LVKYGKVLLPEILRLEEMKKPKSGCKNRSKAEPFSTVSEIIKGSAIVVISPKTELNLVSFVKHFLP